MQITNDDDITFNLIQSIIQQNEKKESQEVFAENAALANANRWMVVGLLEGLNEDERIVMAVIFEEILDYMLSGELLREFGDNEGQLETFAFPAARRLLKAGKLKRLYENRSNVSIRKAVKKFAPKLIRDIQIFKQTPELIEMFRNISTGISGMDAESEMISLYCESFTWKHIIKNKQIRINGKK